MDRKGQLIRQERKENEGRRYKRKKMEQKETLENIEKERERERESIRICFLVTRQRTEKGGEREYKENFLVIK